MLSEKGCSSYLDKRERLSDQVKNEEKMLIIFGGLPGSGKSTLSRCLAERLGAVYLRIDSIETAIKLSTLKVEQAEDAGYLAAYNLASDNLRIGHTVVSDSVNPVESSRKGWQDVAMKEGKSYLEIEVICSDQEEHKRRVAARNSDMIDSTPIVTWEEILQRNYETWETSCLTLDTFSSSVEECIEDIIGYLRKRDFEEVTLKN